MDPESRTNFEIGPEMLPVPGEVLQECLDMETDASLSWVAGGEGQKLLCAARLVQVENHGVVKVSDLLDLEAFDAKGLHLNETDHGFDVCVLPPQRRGAYTLNALRFGALKTETDWEQQVLQQRSLRVDLERAASGGRFMEVQEERELTADTMVALPRGGQIISLLRQPFPTALSQNEAASQQAMLPELMDAQPDTAELAKFFDEYLRLSPGR